jgi:hypothetical protein
MKERTSKMAKSYTTGAVDSELHTIISAEAKEKGITFSEVIRRWMSLAHIQIDQMKKKNVMKKKEVTI